MKGFIFSIVSGTLAATASVCGKFAMSKDESTWLCEHFASDNFDCESISLYTRLIFFILMISTNAVMWTTFVKALNNSATTVEATVVNTAANFFFTAIFGQIFFGEILSIMWWLGTLLIVFGLTLIHLGSKVDTTGVRRSSKKRKLL